MASKHKPHHDKGKKGKGAKASREKPKATPRHTPPAEGSSSQRRRPEAKKHEVPAASGSFLVEEDNEVVVVLEIATEVATEVVEVDTTFGEEVDGDRSVIEHEVEDPLIVEDVRPHEPLEMECVQEESDDRAATAQRSMAASEMADEGVNAMRFPFWNEVEMEMLVAQEEEQMAMMEVELAMQAAEYIGEAELVEEAMVLESNRIVDQWQHALDPLHVRDEQE